MKDDSVPDIPVPSLPLALIPIVLTIALLGVQIFYYDDFTPHIPLAIGPSWTTVGTVGLALIGSLYAQLGWFSRRAEPEAPVGAAVAEEQA